MYEKTAKLLSATWKIWLHMYATGSGCKADIVAENIGRMIGDMKWAYKPIEILKKLYNIFYICPFESLCFKPGWSGTCWNRTRLLRPRVLSSLLSLGGFLRR
jgi:hypothetical protein